MPNPVAVPIELSEGEREQLEAWTRRRTSAKALAQRSRIVLLAAEGLKNTEIAERLGIKRGTAATWRSRFATPDLGGIDRLQYCDYAELTDDVGRLIRQQFGAPAERGRRRSS